MSVHILRFGMSAPRFTQITYDPGKAKLIAKVATVNLHRAVMPLSRKRPFYRQQLQPHNQVCYDHRLATSNKVDGVPHQFQNERSKAGKAQFERSRPL